MTHPRHVPATALRLVLAGVVAASAVGCSSMGGLEPLEVSLSDLEVGEVTVFETTVVARLRITNPNPEPLTVNGGSFKLLLDGSKVGTGTAPESFTVDRLDSVVTRATFNISNAAAVLRIRDIFERRRVSYAIRGSLFADGTFGTRKIKVEKTGTIDLDEPDAGVSP